MHSALIWAVSVSALVLLVTGVVMTALSRMHDTTLLLMAGLVEVTVIGMSLIAAIELARGHEVRSMATVIGYLVGNLLIMPAAVLWGWAERTRWTPAVLALGALTVLAMVVRLTTLWAGRA